MLDFKAELQIHCLTLQQIAEQANVPYTEVYKFHTGAFVFVEEADQTKIIAALSTLTKHPYRLREFVHHPDPLPPLPLPRSKTILLGARGGKQSLEHLEELRTKERGLDVWAMATNWSHHENVHPSSKTEPTAVIKKTKDKGIV